MKISSKGRYGLAALTSMAKHEGEENLVSVITLSERLEISKIYLEQVFSLLKRSGLVVSVKGSSGGYYLAKAPKDITVFEVLSATDTTLFEKTETTTSTRGEAIERSLHETVFNPLDMAIKNTLQGITIEDIANKSGDENMFYI
jgi:Rrf2 family protein